MNVKMNVKMWAYWDNRQQKFYHVYDKEIQVRMCSLNHFENEEQIGEGEVVMVNVSKTKEYEEEQEAGAKVEGDKNLIGG